MLKGISPLISPDLLKVLAELGHCDTIVLADANFPGKTIAARAGIPYLRLDGQEMVPLLEAILTLFPLDTLVPHPVQLMEKSPQDAAMVLPIVDAYKSVVAEWDDRKEDAIGYLDRQEFYAAAGMSGCVVQTGETALYANLILTKGVVV